MTVRLEVWGDGACFTRPEMKAERVSYDVMTPSAARGILEAVYWHPAICWHVDKIYVINPIQFVNIKRNELSEVMSSNVIAKDIRSGSPVAPLDAAQSIQQRNTMMLKDVRYVIEAHFTMTRKAGPRDSSAKAISIFNRRAERGQCFMQPYLGCREFPANFRLWTSTQTPECHSGSRDLGYMLYDLDFSNPKDIHPMFFHAKLVNGMVDVQGAKVLS